MNSEEQIKYDAEGQLSSTWQGAYARIACALHLVSGWIAALLSMVDVETIVGTFFLVLFFSIPLQIAAQRRNSWALFWYGQSGYWAIASVALVIATFDLSPSEAVPAVPVVLIVYAVGLAVWCFLVDVRSLESLPQDKGQRASFRFRIADMLLLTTLICLLSFVGRLVAWQSEMGVFASGAFALIAISGFLTYRYRQRRSDLSVGSHGKTE